MRGSCGSFPSPSGFGDGGGRCARQGARHDGSPHVKETTMKHPTQRDRER